MCERFVENRRDLVDLIFGMEHFTRDDLLERFNRERAGNIAIDGSQTIEQYLRELSEYGILRRQLGSYQVVSTH